jgi:hypothetical protein
MHIASSETHQLSRSRVLRKRSQLSVDLTWRLIQAHPGTADDTTATTTAVTDVQTAQPMPETAASTAQSGQCVLIVGRLKMCILPFCFTRPVCDGCIQASALSCL